MKHISRFFVIAVAISGLNVINAQKTISVKPIKIEQTQKYADNEDFKTSGTGLVYGLKDLALISGSGVEDLGNMHFNITNSITIAEGDKFIIEDNAHITMSKGAVMAFEGDAEMTPKSKTVISAVEDGWAGFNFKSSPNDVEISNIDFTRIVIKYSADHKFTMDNCTITKAPDCKLSHSGAVNVTFADIAYIRNCKFTENEHSGVATGANSECGVTIEGCTFTHNSTRNQNHPQINLSTGGEKMISIRNNVVSGLPELTKVGGISVSNMLGKQGENRIEIIGNTVIDNRYGITVLGSSISDIRDNVLTDNDNDPNAMTGGSGISLYDSKGLGLISRIEGNTIEGSLWGITIIGCKDVNIGKTCVDKNDPNYNRGGNTFKNNGNGGQLYDLYNNSNITVYAQGNKWNVEEQTEEAIEEVIFHQNDDASLGKVIFWDENYTGILGVNKERCLLKDIFNASGIRKNILSHGLNIIKYNDGSFKKVYVK